MPVYELGFEHSSQEVRAKRSIQIPTQVLCSTQLKPDTHTFHSVISMSNHGLFAVVSLLSYPFYGIKKLPLSLFVHWQHICPLKLSVNLAKYGSSLHFPVQGQCLVPLYKRQAHIVQ